MKTSVFLIIFSYVFQRAIANRENEISLSIIRKLSLSHCIVVDDDDDFELIVYTPKKVKYFAEKNIFTTYMSITFLFNYLRFGYRITYPNFKTAIIIQQNKLAEILNDYFYKIPSDYALPQFTWIMFEKSSDFSVQRMNDFYIPLNCQFLLVTKNNNSHYRIIEIYNAKNKSKRLVTPLGFWSEDKKLSITPGTIYERRSDMYGETLVWTTQFEFPCAMLEECLHLEILYGISKILNFTIALWWIFDEKNISRELNLALEGDSRCVVTHSKYFRRDFVGPTFEFKGHFYIKDDVGEKHGIRTYMAPFSKTLWTYVFAYLSFSALSLIIITYGTFANDGSRLGINPLLASTLIPLGIISNQDGHELGENSSSRLAKAAIQMTACVIVPAYSAAVISFLTVSVPKLPFSDLTTFIEDGTYKIGGMANAFSQNYFLTSSDATVVEIKNRFLRNDTPFDYDEAIRRICNSKYAFVGYDNEIFFFKDRPCELLKIPKPIFSVMSGFPLRVSSPYKKFFRKNFLSFYSSGIMKKMRKMVAVKYQKEKKDFVPIDLSRFTPLVKLLIFLGAISVTIFLTENITGKIYTYF